MLDGDVVIDENVRVRFWPALALKDKRAFCPMRLIVRLKGVPAVNVPVKSVESVAVALPVAALNGSTLMAKVPVAGSPPKLIWATHDPPRMVLHAVDEL